MRLLIPSKVRGGREDMGKEDRHGEGRGRGPTSLLSVPYPSASFLSSFWNHPRKDCPRAYHSVTGVNLLNSTDPGPVSPGCLELA